MNANDMTVNDIRLEMYGLLVEESYMKPLLDMAFAHFSNPLMIADHIQHLVDYRQRTTVASHQWQSVIDTGAYDLDFIDSAFFTNFSQVTQTREAISLEVDGYTYYQCSIICHNIYMGSVCVLEYDHEVEEKDLAVLKTMAEIISVKIEPTINHNNEVERRISQTLTDLLDGRIRRASELKYRMKAQKWEEKEVYRVAIFRARESGKALNRHIRQVFSVMYPEVKCTLYNGYLVVLIGQNHKGKIPLDCEEFCMHYNLRVGISNPFNDLLEIGQYYVQAQKALDYSYDRKEARRLSRYCDYVLEDVAHRLSMTEASKLLYHPAVAALADYDRLSKTNFSETFYVYIEQNRSITRTSQKLFQHKNTINYRIQRIKKLLDLDLDDFPQLVHIYMTYRSMDVRKRQDT